MSITTKRKTCLNVMTIISFLQKLKFCWTNLQSYPNSLLIFLHENIWVVKLLCFWKMKLCIFIHNILKIKDRQKFGWNSSPRKIWCFWWSISFAIFFRKISISCFSISRQRSIFLFLFLDFVHRFDSFETDLICIKINKLLFYTYYYYYII